MGGFLHHSSLHFVSLFLQLLQFLVRGLLLLHLALQSLLARSCHLVLLLFLAPVGEVALALHVALGQTEDLQGGNHELHLSLSIAGKLVVVCRVVKEVIARLGELEVFEPLQEESLHHGVVQGLGLLVVVQVVLNRLVDVLKFRNTGYLFSFKKILLDGYTLCNYVAFHGLLLQLPQFLDALFLRSLPSVFDDPLAAGADSVHEVWLVEVVEWLQLEALVQQFHVDLACQAHQPHGFVLHLRHQSLVGVALGSNQLSQEVLAIGFGDRFTLAVEDISQVVVIFLLGDTDLDEGEHVDAGREEDLGVEVDAPHFSQDLSMLALNFFEV